MHALGAFLNIGPGNVLLVMVGARSGLYGLPRWLGGLVLTLGIVGLVALVALVLVPALSNREPDDTA